jgi:hypothetical protein
MISSILYKEDDEGGFIYACFWGRNWPGMKCAEPIDADRILARTIGKER